MCPLSCLAFVIEPNDPNSPNTFRCCLDNQSYYLCADDCKIILVSINVRKSDIVVWFRAVFNDCRKTTWIPKLLCWPITIGENKVMTQSEIQHANALLKMREKLRVYVKGSIRFAPHLLKSWREVFVPITTRNNSKRVITFDSLLETALNTSKTH